MKRIYICLGPHCRGRGAADVHIALEDAIWRAGLSDQITCIAGSCQDRCTIGPNLLVYPGGCRFHGVTPTELPTLIAQLADTGV